MYTIKANINSEFLDIRFCSIYPEFISCVNEKFFIHGLDTESIKIVKLLFDNIVSFEGELISEYGIFDIINCHFEEITFSHRGEATLRIGLSSCKDA